MEDQAWVGSVSLPEWCCGDPWWCTHRGLPPDPQRWQSNRESITGGEASWIKPATNIIQTRCGRVQRSASQRGRRSRIICSPRKSTSGGAGKQKPTADQELLTKGSQRQPKHPFTTCRKDREETEKQLKNYQPQQGRSRQERHGSSELPRRTDKQVSHC